MAEILIKETDPKQTFSIQENSVDKQKSRKCKTASYKHERTGLRGQVSIGTKHSL
jgi:hypothetical protein